MIATVIGVSVRVWTAAADPDNNVQTSGGLFPDIGEFFLNTTTGGLFLCTLGTSGAQTWQPGTNQALILAIVAASRTQSAATRSLNSIFQISATKGAFVNYSVDVSTSLTLTTGQSGTVIFEIASNSGFTANVQEVSRFTNANTGALAIGLSLTQTVTGNLGGYVPPGYYARLRTINNTGTPTFTYQSGQELLM